jgi:hypothetical protein
MQKQHFQGSILNGQLEKQIRAQQDDGGQLRYALRAALRASSRRYTEEWELIRRSFNRRARGERRGKELPYYSADSAISAV